MHEAGWEAILRWFAKCMRNGKLKYGPYFWLAYYFWNILFRL